MIAENAVHLWYMDLNKLSNSTQQCFHNLHLDSGKNIVILALGQHASHWYVYNLTLCDKLSSVIATQKASDNMTPGRTIQVYNHCL